MKHAKLISLILALSAIPMSIDATVFHLPGMPPQISAYWPLVLAAASVVHKVASVFAKK